MSADTNPGSDSFLLIVTQDNRLKDIKVAFAAHDNITLVWFSVDSKSIKFNKSSGSIEFGTGDIVGRWKRWFINQELKACD